MNVISLFISSKCFILVMVDVKPVREKLGMTSGYHPGLGKLLWWHSGAGGSVVASQLQGPQVDPEFGLLSLFTWGSSGFSIFLPPPK